MMKMKTEDEDECVFNIMNINLYICEIWNYYVFIMCTLEDAMIIIHAIVVGIICISSACN